QFVGRPVARQIDMNDLPESMDAGIGPAGSLDGNGLGRQRQDRPFQRRLHGMAVFLPLPADIGGAVIFDGHPVTRHQPSLVPAGSGMPRRKSAASSGLPPAFCSRVSRTAPLPQATARLSSSTSPGAPPPSVLSEPRILMRSGFPLRSTSIHAPGKGERPRM